MATANARLSTSVPAGWNDVIVRTLQVLVVAFLVLVLKEWLETKEFDLKACVIDGSWVAGGVFVLYSILLMLAPRRAA
jgi:hypothetical protein